MKLFIGVALFIWLVCGLAGDWLLEDGGSFRWQAVAKGPITLVKAMQKSPPTFRGYPNS